MSIKLQQEGVPGQWFVRGSLTGTGFKVPSAIVEQFSPFDQDTLDDLARMLSTIYKQGVLAGKVAGVKEFGTKLQELADEVNESLDNRETT